MIKITGKLILKEPVVHGALVQDIDKRSNALEIRKIPVLNRENGDFVMVPAVSGNSIKNSTRRIFMANIFETLGINEKTNVPLDVIYFFFAGGTTSNAKPIPPSQQEFKKLRDKLPFLDLLGGSYKGHFFCSQVIVGFAIPALKETVSFYPEIAEEGTLTAAELSATIAQNPIGYTKTALEGSKEGLDEEEKGQMLYFFEALPIGVTLLHYFSLRNGTSELTKSCFYAFIKTFITEGKLGGATSKGHGSFVAHYYEDSDELTSEMLTEKAQPFWDYLRTNKDDIVATIQQIPDVLQAKEKENKKDDKE